MKSLQWEGICFSLICDHILSGEDRPREMRLGDVSSCVWLPVAFCIPLHFGLTSKIL